MAARLLFLLLLLACFGARAAEFKFVQRDGVGPATIRLDGPITAGDAKKLSEWITTHPSEYLITNNIQLSSGGGSVQEAVAIAQLVESSGWTALVSTGDTCASACFFIFASAQVRISAGNVIVHRPYFDEVAKNPSDHFRQIGEQRTAALVARDYLTAKGISSGLIDKMMSLPSSRGYVLTSQDYNELGYLAPVAEEQAIRRCSIDNVNFLVRYPNNRECLEAIFIPLRNSMIETALGADALEAAGPRARALYLNQARSNL